MTERRTTTELIVMPGVAEGLSDDARFERCIPTKHVEEYVELVLDYLERTIGVPLCQRSVTNGRIVYRVYGDDIVAVIKLTPDGPTNTDGTEHLPGERAPGVPVMEPAGYVSS